MTTDFGNFIAGCRKNFRPPPRQLSPQEQAAFRLEPAIIMGLYLWLSRDPLRRFLHDQDLLRDHGHVVWGFSVQANQVLFDPANRGVRPAVLLYSPDSYYDNDVDELAELASGLYELKGTLSPDPELAQFVNAITNEMARATSLQLPRSLCDGRVAYFSTFLVQPSHLPANHLAQGIFPLVICPERTQAVMILPATFWPSDLRDWWTLG